MKEIYHSPELRLLCFVPAEELSSGTADDEIVASGNTSGVLPDIGDIDISID